MKTTKQTPATKLVNRFDKELMTLLMSDLKAVKAIKQKMLNINGQHLNAA
ncbi:hypothetical protein [Mucilaginibacter terrenus]|nr:hypothetical protein [Mucilaginibacter terrenus]